MAQGEDPEMEGTVDPGKETRGTEMTEHEDETGERGALSEIVKHETEIEIDAETDLGTVHQWTQVEVRKKLLHRNGEKRHLLYREMYLQLVIYQ